MERGRFVTLIRRGESVRIGDDIEIHIATASPADRVRLLVLAPKDVKLQREGTKIDEEDKAITRIIRPNRC